MDYRVADRLIELRKKNGYSQDELADKLSVSRQAVSKWERAESLPDTENLIALARIYDVSLDELIIMEGTTRKNPQDSSDTAVSRRSSFVSQRTILLVITLVGVVAAIIGLVLAGYFVAELIEIHQPGYIFEPGDTLVSERIGYIISLILSLVLAVIGVTVAIISFIKYRIGK